MKNKKYLLFDLDGTVADSAPGVIASAKEALEKMGYAVPDDSVMPRFLGPPLSYSFKTYAGVPEDKVDEAIRLYREHYRVDGIYRSTLYPGAADFFGAAKEKGKVLLIASSKPLPFVKEVLRFLDVAKYFDHAAGADFSSTHLSKAGIVAQALEMAAAPKEESVMIGDRIYDVEGARDNGLPCVGIVNGSIFKEELENCGAVAVAKDFYQLTNILL